MSKLNVLIVEDDHDFAEMLRESFLAAGNRVKVVFDGKQAISFLNKAIPDLVILDFYMPGHNAVEFINEVKSYTDTRNIPIFLYSAHASNINNIPEGVSLFDKTKTTPKQLAREVNKVYQSAS